MNYNELVTDSFDYWVIEESLRNIQNIEGLTLEIGLREGGCTKLIIDTLLKTNQKKIHIAIDPYGNIEYAHWESKLERLDYSNSMKNKTLSILYDFCFKNNQEFIFFPLEDTEFFEKFKNGIPVYQYNKSVINQYSLVFVDGPHTTECVKKTFDFFKDKISTGGYIIFDDIHQYPHIEKLDSYIESNSYLKQFQTPCKISYKKI